MLLCWANPFEEGRAKVIEMTKKTPPKSGTALGRIISRQKKHQDKTLLCIKQMEIMLRNTQSFKMHFFQ